jgi:FkbM family methyltransferase
MENKLCVSTWDLYNRVLNKANPKISFDIGANEGGMIDSLLSKSESVHAFEPVPDMFQKCSRRFLGNPRVVVNNLAVSDKIETVKNVQVHLSWALLQDEGRRDVALDYVGKPKFDMNTTTIDSYCESIGAAPGFIKLDVDGYELRVLRGGIKTLSQNPIPMVFEYSFLPTLIGDSIEEMCRLIYALGYKAVSMDGSLTCQSAEQMISHYPAHTSFDIMLIPNGFVV